MNANRDKIYQQFTFDDYVTIKCNKCGQEIGFFPLRIIVSPKCFKCGNEDTGYCLRDWADLKFGDFTFVRKERWLIPSF